MRRALVVSLAVLCAATVWAAPIDFHAPGQTLGTAVDRLGQQIGRRLFVSANIRDEVVVIHVTDVEADELLKRIADVANAQWRTTASGDVLERTPAMETELKKESIARRAAAIEEYLEPFKDALKKELTFEDAKLLSLRITDNAKGSGQWTMNQEARDLYAQGPFARLAHRLLATIDAKDLADLLFGGRRVFALKPTALQRPFGAGAKEALAAFVREQNAWAAATDGLPMSDGPGIVSNPMTRRGRIDAPRDDYILIVKRMGMDAILFCDLARPRANYPMMPDYQVIAQPANRQAMYAAIGRLTSLPDSVPKLVKHVLLGHFYSLAEAGEPPSAEELEPLWDPTKFDLPGAMADPLLSQMFAGSDVVALLSDDGAMAAPMLFAVISNGELLEKYFPVLSQSAVKRERQWVMVQPADPHMATLKRTPRGAARQLLAESRKSGRASFDTVAAFNCLVNEPSMLAVWLMEVLGVEGNGEMTSTDFWHVSRLYGSLTSGQRHGLVEGGALRYGQLSTAQKRFFVALATSDEIDNRTYSAERGSYQLQSAGREPTIALAQGIPFDAALTLVTTSDREVFVYKRSGQKTRSYGLSGGAEGLVSQIRMAEDLSRRPAGYPEPLGFAMGTRVRRMFRLEYSPTLWQLFMPTEDVRDPDAKPGPWTALPPEIVKRAKEALGGGGAIRNDGGGGRKD